MDMAIEIETRAEHVDAICRRIPPQYKVGERPDLDTIEASVAHMVTVLSRQSAEIAALQLRTADRRIASDEQALAHMLERIAEMIEADTSLEILPSGDCFVHFDGKAYEASRDDALEMLDAAGTLARSVRRG